jgi:dipeptide transport system permease protein
MFALIVNRLGLLIPTFLGVTLIAFALIHLIPGDPIELMVGERGIDPQRHAQLMADMGLDKPLWQQYLVYIFNVFQGDLGSSLVTREPVLEEFFTLFPATLDRLRPDRTRQAGRHERRQDQPRQAATLDRHRSHEHVVLRGC